MPSKQVNGLKRRSRCRQIPDRNIGDYGKQVDAFMAVDNILPQHYPEEVFESIAPPVGANIFYQTKANLSYGQMKKMIKADIASQMPFIL